MCSIFYGKCCSKQWQLRPWPRTEFSTFKVDGTCACVPGARDRKQPSRPLQEGRHGGERQRQRRGGGSTSFFAAQIQTEKTRAEKRARVLNAVYFIWKAVKAKAQEISKALAT